MSQHRIYSFFFKVKYMNTKTSAAKEKHVKKTLHHLKKLYTFFFWF